MLRSLPVFLILFIALFGGMIISFGVPRYFSIISELLIYIFLVSSILSRSRKFFPIPHLWQIVLLFIFITLLSMMINELPAQRSIFSLRLLFRYYFFYLALIIMDPDDNAIKIFNLLIVALLVAQFPIVGLKFIRYGIDERTAGAYAIHDGSIATTLPVTFIFYLASYYFIHKQKFVYLVIGFGYIILSIVGAKRAVLFLYPVQFMLIFYYLYAKGNSAAFYKKFAMFTACTITIIVVSASILYFNKSLSPNNEIGGKIDITYAFEYAERYNSGVDGYGRSFGRIATSQRVIEKLSESGFLQVIFGIGPGATTPSFLDSAKERKRFKEKYENFDILYGWTPMNRIAMEYGIAGVLAFFAMLVIFTKMCIKLYKKERDTYWKAFSFGSVCFSFSMLFFAFAYHWTTFWGDTMPVLYFYAMAVVYTRLNYRFEMA